MPFSSGVAAICVKDACGLIDSTGKIIVPLKDGRITNLATRYSDGVGPFARGDLWGYVDQFGQVVIQPRFKYAGDFSSGMARVALDGKYFFIDHKGNRVTPEFDGLFDFREELAAALVGDRVGYIKRDGTFAIPPKYYGTSGIDFSEGLVAVRIDGKVGFMNKTEAIVVPPTYDDAYPFSEGLAPVRIGESWGYINKAGKMAIPAKYRAAHMFSEGVASVYLADTGKAGYIDHTGAFQIVPTFDQVTPFCAGLASVATYRIIGPDPNSLTRTRTYEGRRGLIDHSGKYIWRDPRDRVGILPPH
jgi:hypothetical protein